MSYKRISNDPFQRHRVTFPYCTWDDAFTEDELNDIENYCETFDKQTAKVNNDIKNLDKIRKSKVAWFNIGEHPKLHNLFNKLNVVIEQINENYYNFDLNGYSFVQYTTYDAKENGEYDYHIDMHTGNKLEDYHLKYNDTRKLSLSLILSDSQSYGGGKFTMKLGTDEFEMEQKRGRIIFFPSFFLHKVYPLTKGVRKSIVTWVEGPKFR
jgi:PKHD-type hydroxylase